MCDGVSTVGPAPEYCTKDEVLRGEVASSSSSSSSSPPLIALLSGLAPEDEAAGKLLAADQFNYALPCYIATALSLLHYTAHMYNNSFALSHAARAMGAIGTGAKLTRETMG